MPVQDIVDVVDPNQHADTVIIYSRVEIGKQPQESRKVGGRRR